MKARSIGATITAWFNESKKRSYERLREIVSSDPADVRIISLLSRRDNPKEEAVPFNPYGSWHEGGPDPQLIDAFDATLQARFGSITDEDIKRGWLGLTRAFNPIAMTYTPKSDEERLAIKTIESQGWECQIFALENGPNRPAKSPPRLVGPVSSHGLPVRILKNNRETMQALSFLTLATGARTRSSSDGVFLEARPVLASSPSCLRCHPGKKLGDPLGTIVYAFTRRRPAP